MADRTGLCLSVQQPWAWLIVNGYKTVENRDWATKVRGLFGIHAGKKLDVEGLAWVCEQFPHIELPRVFALGGVVGRARLINCIHERDAHLLTARDKLWFRGKCGFVLDSAEPLPYVPCRGQLGFFRPQLSVATSTQGTT